MKSVKSLTLMTLITATSSAFGVYGPCNIKQPHTTFSVDGELLYWRPDQTAMIYSFSTNAASTIFGSQSKEFQQGSDWALGFRVGAGLDFVKALSDIRVHWTHFHNTSHSSNTEPFIFGTQLLSPTSPFSIGGSGNGAGNAHSSWHLNLDIVDGDLGYDLCFKKRYLLRPYIGAAGGWIHQTQTIRYNNFLDTSNSVFFNAKITQKNDFHGVGPKVGMSGHYSIHGGFGLLGNLSATFLYGKANNPTTVDIPDDPLGFPIPNMQVIYKRNRLIPFLQAQVGLTWGVSAAKHFRIDLSALYEAQYFWGTWRNQNSMIQNLYISDAGYGNLMLQGGTFQLKLSF